jgi:hypothetical protein
MSTRLTNSILIVLLLLYLAFAGHWLINRSRRNNEGQNREAMKGAIFLSGKLNFDSAQRDQVKKLLMAHAGKIRKYKRDISRLSEEIFKYTDMQVPDTVHAYLCADSIGIYRATMQKEKLRNSFAI